MKKLKKPVVSELPVGTEFFVINGAWNGKVVLNHGVKYVLIIEKMEEILLVPAMDTELNVTTKSYEEEMLNSYMGPHLINAEENCDHHIEAQWSGVKCSLCDGWYCA